MKEKTSPAAAAPDVDTRFRALEARIVALETPLYPYGFSMDLPARSSAPIAVEHIYEVGDVVGLVVHPPPEGRELFVKAFIVGTMHLIPGDRLSARCDLRRIGIFGNSKAPQWGPTIRCLVEIENASDYMVHVRGAVLVRHRHLEHPNEKPEPTYGNPGPPYGYR